MYAVSIRTREQMYYSIVSLTLYLIYHSVILFTSYLFPSPHTLKLRVEHLNDLP